MTEKEQVQQIVKKYNKSIADLSENASFVLYCQLAVLVLAALVSYCTGCFACRLAGCLALAAAAFFDCVL